MITVISATLLSQKLIKHEGFEPYSPAKLEWAALELEAYYRIDDFRKGSIILQKDWIQYGDHILCRILYNSNAPAGYVEKVKNQTEELFETFKKGRSWDWLRLEIEIECQDIDDL